MSDVNELVNRYIDTWNEKDPAARRPDQGRARVPRQGPAR